MIRLLVVDDHIPSLQEAVAELAIDNVIEIVGQAETSDEAYKMAVQLLPDVVLLDLHLPGLMSTNDLIKKLSVLKNGRVIVNANEGKASQVHDLFDAGASAYVVKSDPWPLIRMTIVMVYKGTRNVISPTLPKNLMRLSVSERNILHEISRRGGAPKAAERIGVSEYDLHQMLEHLAEKLELKDADKLLKWCKKHSF